MYEEHKKGVQIHRRSYAWREFDRIGRVGDQEEPLPVKSARGKPKKTKGRNLLERMVKHKESVLKFALQRGIPFINNQAERDVRLAKGKLKVAGCFRTWTGAQQYARLQGVF